MSERTGTPPSVRCTSTNHFVKAGFAYCDCKALYVCKSATGDDQQVLVVDPVQRGALLRMGAAA